MRIIAALLIALIAIMGIATATIDDVKIKSPHDGDQFSIGDTVKIRSLVATTDEQYISVRTLINDMEVRKSNWVPTEAGIYTIMVEATNNRDESKIATVTIEVM